jgi:YbbR domain-containing protein
MAWREFITHNRWQKLGSLVLAVLIWLTVNADLGMERVTGLDPNRVRTFENVPVGVFAVGGEDARFQIKPATVNVEVHGEPGALRRLQTDDLEAYVNLANAGTGTNLIRRVHVRAPGVRHAEAMPEEVRIERIK